MENLTKGTYDVVSDNGNHQRGCRYGKNHIKDHGVVFLEIIGIKKATAPTKVWLLI